MEYNEVKRNIQQENWFDLYQTDQVSYFLRLHCSHRFSFKLRIESEAGNAFSGFMEAPIGFPPTYRYDIGTDNYDTRFVFIPCLFSVLTIINIHFPVKRKENQHGVIEFYSVPMG
jgi:hypothetical protein